MMTLPDTPCTAGLHGPCVSCSSAEAMPGKATAIRMFLLRFVSALFHLKAATLASNISGASDGPGAAAAVVGAGMTGLAALKGAAMWGAKKGAGGAGAAAAAIGKAGEANHDRLWRPPASPTATPATAKGP